MLKKKIRPLLSVLLLTWLTPEVLSQDVLDTYIREGLSNNLILKQKKGNLEKGLTALKEARSLFLPTSWFETQYTIANGGRSIDIPVGDLMNPVYKTLNQLTGSNGFPQIGNVSEQFFPDNFYDVRIKTTMPIINPDLKINRQIKQQETELALNDIDMYKRELVKEIKTAYYNYLMADKAVTIYENALEVVTQNLKVNKTLLANGKGLYAYVSRAESEVRSVEAQLQTAKNERRNAQAYFNFLLNKPFTDSVHIQQYEMSISLLQNMMADDSVSVIKREELKALNIAQGITTGVLKMNRSFRTPRLNTFFDLGAQGFDFKVNNNSFFYLAGLQLQIPLFSGKRNLYKIEKAEIELKNLAVNTEHTQKQLNLAAFVSRNNVMNSYNTYLASAKQQEAAQQYFKLIDRGYKEGINSFIEMLDARNQLTNSQLQVNINTYKLLSALADYERQTASYSINQ